MKRVLVTGSAGFVGTHLIRLLTNFGFEVGTADKKTGLDLTSLDNAKAIVALTRPDVIVHLASSCSTPGSVARPLETFADTVVTAVNILEAARPDQIPTIITSSVKARDGETPYGAAKCMVETWTREYRRCYEVPIIVNRPGTIYGPGQAGSDESGWIAWFCRARDEGLTVTINGDGEQVRDLLHVTDYTRLLARQIRHFEEYEGRTFDVGGGEENAVSVNQIVRHLGLSYIHGPARVGDARQYIAYNDVPHWGPEIRWYESETLR